MTEPLTLGGHPMSALEMLSILERAGHDLDTYLADEIYVNRDADYLATQRDRFAATLRLHGERVGDRPAYLLRAPGRLNAFLEYLDMCAGDHMSTTIDGDIIVAVSPRMDDRVTCANSHPLFPSDEFSIADEAVLLARAPWEGEMVGELSDNWDNRTRIYPHFGRTRGDWINYVRSPFLRTVWELPNLALRGADVTFGPSTAPFRAGTSSSSAVVVLSFLALYLANYDQLPVWDISEICRLLGEAEWYVGTHGGANDQTTILRNQPNGVLYNRHSQPELTSTPLPCLKGVRVVLANSLWEANKTLGANHNFNLRKGWMDLGDDILSLIIRTVSEYLEEDGNTESGWLVRLLEERFGFAPGYPPRHLESDLGLWDSIAARYHRFGSLAEDILGIPDAAIEELIGLLPSIISPERAGELLGKDSITMERDYTLPYPDEQGYKIRNAAVFFHKENRIGRALERIFLDADEGLGSGQLTEDSLGYDQHRWQVGSLLEQLQETLRDDFQVSNEQLDLLLEIARGGFGYLGGKLTGAGSGGCVSILVREGSEDDFCGYLDHEYYLRSDRFDRYRSVLDELERNSTEGSAQHQAAVEMRSNLEHALSCPSEQRRAVTFSRGACVLELDRFKT